MRFDVKVSEEEILDTISDLGCSSDLPSIVDYVSERHSVSSNHRSLLANQILRRLAILVKYRFVRRTGQKGHYVYHLEDE